MKKNRNLVVISIILISVFLVLATFVLYNAYYTQESMVNLEDKRNKKTIYLVWRNKKIEKENMENLINLNIRNMYSSGLGDKIRGAIYIYQYCRLNNINMVIDGTDDICSQFLKNVKSKYYNKIKNVNDILFINAGSDSSYRNFKTALSTKNEVYVFTNEIPPNNLSDEDKEFGKYLCQPVEEIEVDVNETIQKLPSNYGIQHFRFDDTVFEKDVNINNPVFQNYFEILKRSYKNTDVLISNSNNFKKYAKENLNIKTIDCDGDLCKIAHIGAISDDNVSVKNSFIDFYIITKSKYINTHSTYNWVSNFVLWPSKIYDIPLNNILVDPITGKIR